MATDVIPDAMPYTTKAVDEQINTARSHRIVLVNVDTRRIVYATFRMTVLPSKPTENIDELGREPGPRVVAVAADKGG